MAAPIYGNLTIIGGEIIGCVVENLSGIPPVTVTESGRLIFDSTTQNLLFNNGSSYVVLNPKSSTTLINSIGFLNPDNSFKVGSFASFTNVSNLSPTSSLLDVLTQLDTAISTPTIKNIIDIENVKLSNNLNKGDLLFFNGLFYSFTTIKNIIDNYSPLSINDTTDVTYSTSIINGDILTYDTSVNKFVNSQIFFTFIDTTPSKFFIVPHTLNTKYCDVQIINTATSQKVLDIDIVSINFINSTEINVTLSVAMPVHITLTNSNI